MNLNTQVSDIHAKALPMIEEAKALAAKDKHPRWKQSGRVLFVGYDFGATGGFKSKTKYVGTFPIVYVRNPATHEFEHIGGGEDLEKYVDKVNSSGKLIL